MSDLKEYRSVGGHPASLEGGRMVGSGEPTGPIDPTLPANAQLIEDGHLVEVPDGAFKDETGEDPPEPHRPDDNTEVEEPELFSTHDDEGSEPA